MTLGSQGDDSVRSIKLLDTCYIPLLHEQKEPVILLSAAMVGGGRNKSASSSL